MDDFFSIFLVLSRHDELTEIVRSFCSLCVELYARSLVRREASEFVLFLLAHFFLQVACFYKFCRVSIMIDQLLFSINSMTSFAYFVDLGNLRGRIRLTSTEGSQDNGHLSI